MHQPHMQHISVTMRCVHALSRLTIHMLQKLHVQQQHVMHTPLQECRSHTVVPRNSSAPGVQVFRGLPGLAAKVKARSPPLEQWRSFVYCEAMAAGQLLGEVDHFPGVLLLLCTLLIYSSVLQALVRHVTRTIVLQPAHPAVPQPHVNPKQIYVKQGLASMEVLARLNIADTAFTWPLHHCKRPACNLSIWCIAALQVRALHKTQQCPRSQSPTCRSTDCCRCCCNRRSSSARHMAAVLTYASAVQ
jgi:hypothetical protein